MSNVVPLHWSNGPSNNRTLIMCISASGRKNCWVSIKDWHLIKARILAIWLSLFASCQWMSWVYWRLKCGGEQTCHSIDSRCVNLLASCVNIWVCSKDVYRSNKCILQIVVRLILMFGEILFGQNYSYRLPNMPMQSNPSPPMQCELRWVFAYLTNGYHRAKPK